MILRQSLSEVAFTTWRTFTSVSAHCVPTFLSSCKKSALYLSLNSELLICNSVGTEQRLVVSELPNLAYQQQTWQSSTNCSIPSYCSAGYAVDGNFNSTSGMDCSLTAIGDSNPWLGVDLGQQYYVQSLVIFGRAAGYGNYTRIICMQILLFKAIVELREMASAYLPFPPLLSIPSTLLRLIPFYGGNGSSSENFEKPQCCIGEF